MENSLNFTKNLVKEAVYNQFFDTYLFNSSDYNMDGILPKEKYLTKRFGDGYKLIIDFINAEYDEFKKHEEDDTYLNTRPKKMFVFYGASAIINIMDNDTKKAFAEAMKKNGEMNLVSIVFVENVELLKNYAYEDWFKSGVDQTKGIWVGSGIAEQSLIRVARIEQEYRADILNDYGFVIVNSRVNCVKLLGNFETTGK